MSNPFNRTLVHVRERPLSTQINAAQTRLEAGIRQLAYRLLQPRAGIASDGFATPVAGFLGGSLKVRPSSPPDGSVVVKAGLGFFYNAANVPATAIDGATGADDTEVWAPLYLSADQSLAVPASPPAGQARIDIVEVRVSRSAENSQSRDVLDAGTGTFNANALNVDLTFDLLGKTGSTVSPAPGSAALNYKVGVSALAGSEVEPPVSPGYQKIGRVNVAGLAATYDDDVLVDYRRLLVPGGVLEASGRADLSTTGPGATTLERLVAPPGLRLAASTVTPSTGEIRLYVLHGQANVEAVVHAAPQGDLVTALGVVGLMADVFEDSVPNAVVDATVQAELADPLKTSPVLDVGIGQPYTSFKVSGLKIKAGGTVTSTLTPDFSFVRWAFRLSYKA